MKTRVAQQPPVSLVVNSQTDPSLPGPPSTRTSAMLADPPSLHSLPSRIPPSPRHLARCLIPFFHHSPCLTQPRTGGQGRVRGDRDWQYFKIKGSFENRTFKNFL
ncbi:hypothetical protein E2C01_052020 [Portunus trituberculatus]|uniref:Uncharacterized protein n=1 Tax=Portunus trituberculatus TaxID=210409 RepID=A0A5B7GLY5_PORTR|nr:hypothetical protein [Portunus trituberculatus]